MRRGSGVTGYTPEYSSRHAPGPRRRHHRGVHVHALPAYRRRACALRRLRLGHLRHLLGHRFERRIPRVTAPISNPAAAAAAAPDYHGHRPHVMRRVLVQRPWHRRRGDDPLERVRVAWIQRIQSLILHLHVRGGQRDQSNRDREHCDFGHQVPGPKLGRRERGIRAHRRGVILDVVVQAVPHVARHGERRDHAGLRPVAKVPGGVVRRRRRRVGAEERLFKTGIPPPSVTARTGVQAAPEGYPPVLRGNQRVARVLPVPRTAVRSRPAAHQVTARTLRQVSGRALNRTTRTLVNDAILSRRERLEARADLPRASREVGVPHGRERVRVFPVGVVRAAHVRNARVLLHVYPQSPRIACVGRVEVFV